MKKYKLAFPIFSFLLILLISLPLRAANLEDLVKDYTLENGIRVLLVPRPQSPTVSLYIAINVGSIMDLEGQTGTAHFLEHLMFKGTKTLGTNNFEAEKPLLNRLNRVATLLDQEVRLGVKADAEKIKEYGGELSALQKEHSQYVIKDELSGIYIANGGVNFNASTGYDLTTYHINLPRNRVELWAAAESDRLTNPVFRELYRERGVIMEERRQRVGNSPHGQLVEEFLAAAFVAHPYRRPILGWTSDMQFLNHGNVSDFYKRHYYPQRYVITAVGGFETDELLRIIKKYFGAIPKAENPQQFSVVEEPPQNGERRVDVISDAQPELVIGFHKPTLPTKEDYVFDVIQSILTEGKTSKLYRKLVEELGIAQSVTTYNGYPAGGYDNLFVIFAKPRNGHSTDELEAAIYEELERLKTDPITQWELTKTVNLLRMDFLSDLGSNNGLASRLSYYETVTGDWQYTFRHADEISRIKPEDVMDTAEKYFRQSNRTVARLVPYKE
jgi:predicted Zn-dependent peptidase